MSDADGPHASPGKRSSSTSFFGKLMDKHKSGGGDKKDSNADDPSSSPTASPDAATPAPKSGRGASGAPTSEDLQLLMDQLSALSQSLADAAMSNKELTDKCTRLQLLHDQSKIETQFMVAKCEAHEKEMTRLREKISFANLDATNESLKQARNEVAQTREENEALKAQNQILYQNYADINAELQSMHEEAEAKSAEIARLTAEKTELTAAREALEVERADEAAQVAELRAALAALEEQASSDRDRLRSQAVDAALAEASSLRDQLSALQSELHSMTTDRNRCRRLAESCQNDVKKAHAILASRSGDSDRLLEENQKLRADLQRKSKSLQDALQALNNAATGTGGFSSAEPIQPQPTAALGSSSSISGRDLLTLQSLCNRLSESLIEKESQLTVLKKQCLGLGKRVIELEAGTIPDFSDKAYAAREAEEKAKQMRDRREIEGLIEANQRMQQQGAGGGSSDGSEPASASASSSSAAGLSINAAAADSSNGAAPLLPSPAAAPGPSSSPLAISTPLSPSHQRLRSTQLNSSSSRHGSRRSSGAELP